MYGYIYITTNLINNMKYIGQHKADKLDESYYGSGSLITKAIKKYGKDNFKIEIIEWCNSKKELNDCEIFWINKYDALNSRNFYNLTPGGDGVRGCEPWNKGKHQPLHENSKKGLEIGWHLPASEKLKEKLRNRKELVEYTPEYRSKLSNAQSMNRTVNDGIKNIIIKVWELDEYLNNGYMRGRVKKIKRFND